MAAAAPRAHTVERRTTAGGTIYLTAAPVHTVQTGLGKARIWAGGYKYLEVQDDPPQ